MAEKKTKTKTAAKAADEAAIAVEQIKMDDAAEQRIASLRAKWGNKFDDSGHANPYSIDELNELESIYQTQAAEYKGAITQRIDLALQEISISRLEWKKCMGVGDSQGAKRYADMINSAMAREGMRATDGKPIETPKTDSIIDGMEKMGLARGGKILGKKELLPALARVLMRKYNTSMDVVDAMMFCTINTMRSNNGLSELTELPLTAQIHDGGEQLRKENSPREQAAFNELGMVKPLKEAKKK